MIGAEREGGDGFEIDFAGAVGVEQFRRQLAEAQALAHMAFGGAKARGNFVNRCSGVDHRRHGDKLICRMHGGAHCVFHQ